MLKSTGTKRAVFLVLTITYIYSRKHKYRALNCKLWDVCLRQGVSTACRAIFRSTRMQQLYYPKQLWQVWFNQDLDSRHDRSFTVGANTAQDAANHPGNKEKKKQKSKDHTTEDNILKTTTGEKKKWRSHVMLTWTHVLDSGQEIWVQFTSTHGVKESH